MTGGYVGVDVFFVISGFLITSILHRELQTGRFSIQRFYERRIRRIFPALFLMLLVVAAVGAALLLPHEMAALGRSLAATTLFASNFYFWRQGDYFDADVETLPLLHTWSLAIEEQFYLFFPLFLWAVYRWRRRALMPLLAAALLGSLALSMYAVEHWTRAAFYLLPTRAWELAVGSALALARIPKPGYVLSNIVAIAGTAGILGSALFFNADMPFPGAAALPACLGAAAIIYGEGSTVSRVLSMRVPVAIGLISYSLYLWHWPALAFTYLMEGPTPPITARAAAVLLAVALAALTWQFVERPFRHVRVSRQLLAFGAACLIAGIGIALTVSTGLPNRWTPQAVATAARAQREITEMNQGYQCSHERFPGLGRLGPCELGVPGHPRLIVLGDSHAMALRPALQRVLDRAGISATLLSAPGCPPIFGMERTTRGSTCAVQLDAFRRYIESAHPDTVLIIGAWRGVLLSKDTVYHGRVSRDSESRAMNISEGIANTIATLHARGAYVGFVLPPPGALMNVPNTLARGGHAPMRLSRNEHYAAMAVIQRAAAAADFTVDLARPFCKSAYCDVADVGGPLFVDTSHLSPYGLGRVEGELTAAVGRLPIPSLGSVRAQ